MNTIYQAYAAEDGNVHYKDFIENFLFKDPPQVANSRHTNAPNEQPEQENKLELSKKDQPKAQL